MLQLAPVTQIGVSLTVVGCKLRPAKHQSSVKCREASVACFVAHELPLFGMSWGSLKASDSETLDRRDFLADYYRILSPVQSYG